MNKYFFHAKLLLEGDVITEFDNTFESLGEGINEGLEVLRGSIIKQSSIDLEVEESLLTVVFTCVNLIHQGSTTLNIEQANPTYIGDDSND